MLLPEMLTSMQVAALRRVEEYWTGKTMVAVLLAAMGVVCQGV
jgi:hypothetical protein